MRVVVLTSAGEQGHLVLEALARKSIRPYAIVVLAGVAFRDCFHQAGLAARLREAPVACARWIVRRLRFGLRLKRSCAPYSSMVVGSGLMNSDRLLRDLRRLEPGLLLLGGGGILSQDIIDTASVGVLNAHPALLPWARGNVVVGQSLHMGVAAGATCHYVDRLIDTGAIVERRLLPVSGPTTHKQLRERAWQLAHSILADVVARAVQSGEPPPSQQQDERFPLLKFPAPAERKALAELGCSNRARELFELWKPLCLEPENWVLPSTPCDPPEPLRLPDPH